MCKIDLKDAYFVILLSVISRKYSRFQWKDLLCKSYCLFFRLSSAPNLPREKAQCNNNNLYRRHAPNGIFIRGLKVKDLRFLINIKKSYLEPRLTLEFFGVTVDSVEMSLSFSK